MSNGLIDLYDEEIPWPDNLPENMRDSISRLETYREKNLIAEYEIEVGMLEMLGKTEEIFGKITEKQLYDIFDKVGI
ncbi:MAG: hypothetical protein K2H64_09500 [Desulfovibrio sp.]|nr:hypothetical protein [Desulfovibrio sp.]